MWKRKDTIGGWDKAYAKFIEVTTLATFGRPPTSSVDDFFFWQKRIFFVQKLFCSCYLNSLFTKILLNIYVTEFSNMGKIRRSWCLTVMYWSQNDPFTTTIDNALIVGCSWLTIHPTKIHVCLLCHLIFHTCTKLLRTTLPTYCVVYCKDMWSSLFHTYLIHWQ